MAFSSNSGGGNTTPMGDINVTPLVDVMLVLLIIFMVTAPMLSYEIEIDLPQASNQVPDEPKDPPKPIRLRIDDAGTLYWDNTQQTMKTVEILMKIESGGGEKEIADQPTLEIETSPEARYEILAEVLASAKNAGMAKIGFVDTAQ
jgi:biopolymer transport protein ExbD